MLAVGRSLADWCRQSDQTTGPPTAASHKRDRDPRRNTNARDADPEPFAWTTTADEMLDESPYAGTNERFTTLVRTRTASATTRRPALGPH